MVLLFLKVVRLNYALNIGSSQKGNRHEDAK